MHGYKSFLYQYFTNHPTKTCTPTCTSKVGSRRKHHFSQLTGLLTLVIFAALSPWALSDQVEDHAKAMKKAIDIVGIEKFMGLMVKEEQANYPLQKSAYETTLSSTYSMESNTRTEQIALTADWKALYAQAYGKEDVDREFVRNKMLPAYAKHNCTYPPTRLLLDEGATLNYQYSDTDGSYLFTLSYSLKDCQL